jgi:hypothetical protein
LGIGVVAGTVLVARLVALVTGYGWYGIWETGE